MSVLTLEKVELLNFRIRTDSSPGVLWLGLFSLVVHKSPEAAKESGLTLRLG